MSEKQVEAGKLKSEAVLKSPLSVVKMDLKELKEYTEKLNSFLKSPEPLAIRICECCINIS